MSRVLLLGLVPETVDYSDPVLPPSMTAEKIHAGIAVGCGRRGKVNPIASFPLPPSIFFFFASPFVRLFGYTGSGIMRWCTVTVTDSEGRRHSLDLQADSTFDAAHLFVVEAKNARAVGLPKPTLATIFEVVIGGKVYRVTGAALQRWIVLRRSAWKGPKGYLFCQRPGLE